MANIDLKWRKFEFEAKSATGWVAFKKLVTKDELESVLDPRSVYVVRVCRPFCISYAKAHSPVVYIGRGNFQVRITQHIKKWIHPLSEQIPDLLIQIKTCRPRVRHNDVVYKDVEADLIRDFQKKFGEKPLKNKRQENHHRAHTYSAARINDAIGLGQGKGFYWALSPVGSSPLRKK